MTKRKVNLVRLKIFVLLVPVSFVFSQPSPTHYDSVARKIVFEALTSNRSIETLTELTTMIGHRLSGSSQAAEAVEWAKKKMEKFGFENVRLEPVLVPHWVRGGEEKAEILSAGKRKAASFNVTALGGSIGTPKQGMTGEVIEVKSFEQLAILGERARGKIVFFNRPMDRGYLTTFEAYGRAVNQRGRGAIEAAKVGGVAAIVRSMTTLIDDSPHTGAMGYSDTIPKIPAAAISTRDAERLSEMLTKEKNLKLRLKLSCEILPDVESANVLGEILGSEKPDEVIVLGGHLDSWDKGHGAHDDGAGCVHSLEALRLLKTLGLQPKRTIRAVMFMNEENGLRGGISYAAKERPGETHIAAIESDAGGFTPRGFGVGDSAAFKKLSPFAPVFSFIGADLITYGGGGADISPLMRNGVPGIGLNVDSHRYFDYHHSDNDTIDKVNERELALGSAAMAILAYIIAQEGL
ncbi:MAG: M20/M25/M40 family metallo-hydrolase [Ignavibacteriales bacterium]|nr:M20/M25/M40 family metallo-hydrolase [Ignavibacteriales bacterium]